MVIFAPEYERGMTEGSGGYRLKGKQGSAAWIAHITRLNKPGLKPTPEMRRFSAGLKSRSPLLKQGAPTKLRVGNAALDSPEAMLSTPRTADPSPPLRVVVETALTGHSGCGQSNSLSYWWVLPTAFAAFWRAGLALAVRTAAFECRSGGQIFCYRCRA